MIIAITAETNTYESPVCERFGRAPFFVIANLETGEMRAIDNSEGVEATSGAGTQAVQLLADHKVDRLYTGKVGPKAEDAIKKTRIEVFPTTGKTVEQVLQSLVNEGLVAMPKPADPEPVEPSFDAPAEGHRRIAVPADEGEGLGAIRSSHFGRCGGWVLVDIADGKVQQTLMLQNPGHVSGGCMAPVRLLDANHVQALIVGGIGGAPFRGFKEAGIDVHQGVGRTVKETMDVYLQGQLPLMSEDGLCGGH